MNKPLKSRAHRSPFTLGELIVAVSASCRNSREAAAVITDLLETGQVSFLGGQKSAKRRGR
jgi:hypothetical protein